MRIAIVTQEGPFYLPPALDTFCAARRDVVAMVILPAFNERLTATARRLYEFYGPVDFVRLGVRYAGAKLADRLNALGSVTRPYSARDVARRHKIPTYTPAKINAPAFVAVMRNVIRPDLLVSIAASQVFGRDVLEVPQFGSINLHSARLPRYQGMMPNFWTLVHGEPEGTVTVHHMVEKLDAGDIILQRSVPIGPKDSLHDLMVRSKVVGVEALLEVVDLIERGVATRRRANGEVGSYFSFPKRSDAKRLRRMGRTLL